MAKAALTLETAAPMPHTASSLPDIHLALRGVSHTYPARADQGPVPALGQHTDSVLKEFGFSAKQIAALRKANAI